VRSEVEHEICISESILDIDSDIQISAFILGRIHGGSRSDLRVDPASAPVTGAQVLAEAVTGRLVPVIDRRFTLDQLGEAHAAIENRSLLGKALIVI
jgi:Zinc-binding dehydrogenase